jgi:hypothetical protein
LKNLEAQMVHGRHVFELFGQIFDTNGVHGISIIYEIVQLNV